MENIKKVLTAGPIRIVGEIKAIPPTSGPVFNYDAVLARVEKKVAEALVRANMVDMVMAPDKATAEDRL
ncbi:hypothetical protein KAR91_22270 [Candidatus Pacearchaeota archaeon]|nr:hypothetical protein [Candidatus Pacearchaeota archaeon]